MHTDITVPVPPGWTRTDGPDSIVVEGPVPDTAEERDKYVTVTLRVQNKFLSWRGGKIQVRRKVPKRVWVPGVKTAGSWQPGNWVDTGQWRSGGKGGVMLAGTLLHVLANNGRNA